MKKADPLKSIEKAILPILKKNNVVKAGIFGSYARGEAKKTSDLDLLIKIKGKKSLLDLVRLQFALQKKLNKRVDLIEYQEINPLIKKQILKEEIKILYQRT